MKTEIDPAGGTDYTVVGTSQLLSVPFALHAATADKIANPAVETDPEFAKSVAKGITAKDTARWNKHKRDTLVINNVTTKKDTVVINNVTTHKDTVYKFTSNIDTLYRVDSLIMVKYDSVYHVDSLIISRIDTIHWINTLVSVQIDSIFKIDTIFHSRIDTIWMIDCRIDSVTISKIDTLYIKDSITINIVHHDTVQYDDSRMNARIDSVKSDVALLSKMVDGMSTVRYDSVFLFRSDTLVLSHKDTVVVNNGHPNWIPFITTRIV